MVKGKLILICQSGGEFERNDDGTLTYNGGDAEAVNVNSEIVFDDLKLKLAEMCNLKYETVSIKYFLPRNTRTLISLSNDKDLKRMLNFHAKSVTADLFVSGIKGFNHDAMKFNTTRETGIKVAEFVTAARLVKTSPSGTITGNGSSNDFSHDDSDNFGSAPNSHHTTPRKANCQSSTNVDFKASQADMVKKRKHAGSWKLRARGPTIVSIPKDMEDKRSQKNRKISISDVVEGKVDVVTEKEDRIDTCNVTNSDDASLEKLIASWREGIIGTGQDFRNVYEFRDALQKYALANRFVYKLKKNDSNCASGICAAEGCPWKIHASWIPRADSFRIRKFNKLHTCVGQSWKSSHSTKNWLVNITKESLRGCPHHKTKDIVNVISQYFGIELNCTQVFDSIEDARQQCKDSFTESYNQLSRFCDKITETNPGSFVKLVIGDDQRFKSLFVSLNASINGFRNGCRPLLFLESTPLESKYQEILLTATALDGNEGFFPVAFSIVDSENNEQWDWFLDQLRSVLLNLGPLTFVSDRKKGLLKIVHKVFSDSYHGYSMYHLLKSFKKSLKGPFHGEGKASLPGYFIAAAHAVRVVGFKRFTEQIKLVSAQAYDWVMRIEPEYWTTIFSKGERHNQITENMGEMYIKLMEETKELHVTKKIGAIVCFITNMMHSRQAESSKWSMKLTPLKNEKLHEEIVDARGLKVLISSDTQFEVHDEVTHVVDLGKVECTCLGWQTTGLPCRHAIAVFNCKRKNLYDYCSRYFTVDSFHLTYSESISPVHGGDDVAEKRESISESASVLPPMPSRYVYHPKIEEARMVGARSSRSKEEAENKVPSEVAS